MKKLLAILLLSSPAFAAAWTVNTGTVQDSRFERNRIKLNTATCVSVGLAAGCTQTQARAAFCAKGNATAPCTINGASSADVVIYSTIGDYLDRFLIDAHAKDLKASQDAEDTAAWATWLAGATLAQKNAVCTAAGLAAGCLP